MPARPPLRATTTAPYVRLWRGARRRSRQARATQSKDAVTRNARHGATKGNSFAAGDGTAPSVGAGEVGSGMRTVVYGQPFSEAGAIGPQYSSDPCTQMNDCRSIMSRGRKSRTSRRTVAAKRSKLSYVAQLGRDLYSKSKPYSFAAIRVTFGLRKMLRVGSAMKPKTVSNGHVI